MVAQISRFFALEACLGARRLGILPHPHGLLGTLRHDVVASDSMHQNKIDHLVALMPRRVV